MHCLTFAVGPAEGLRVVGCEEGFRVGVGVIGFFVGPAEGLRVVGCEEGFRVSVGVIGFFVYCISSGASIRSIATNNI